MSKRFRPCGTSWEYCNGKCNICNISKRIYITSIKSIEEFQNLESHLNVYEDFKELKNYKTIRKNQE